jgi:hypothetical protein
MPSSRQHTPEVCAYLGSTTFYSPSADDSNELFAAKPGLKFLSRTFGENTLAPPKLSRPTDPPSLTIQNA